MNDIPTSLTDAHLASQFHTYSPSVSPDFARTLERRVAVLREALRDMLAAMQRYEMDVGEPAPYDHRRLMERARAALAATEEKP